MSQRPYTWQMVREAVEHLGSPTTNAAIREYITDKFGEVNPSTLNCTITVCSVNSASRLHFPENKKPRLCDSQYDFLFKTGRGEVALYDPATHGHWELRNDEYGKLVVAQRDVDETGSGDDDDKDRLPFALESHLRDFLAKNISTIQVAGKTLKLYVDEDGRDGVEYPSDVGPMDILAVDSAGNFVVIELKVSKGVDRVVGQALRYMGWVTKHLAQGKKVSGVIVACEIDDKLKYAASVSPNITLFEYKLTFDLSRVSL